MTEQGVTKKLVFSGDIGNTNQPIIKNPHYIKDADYVMELNVWGQKGFVARVRSPSIQSMGTIINQ